MSLVVGILLLWVLLFGPIGALMQRLVLGEGTRTYALVVAPISGVAAATLLFPLSWTLAGSPAPVYLIGVAALGTWGLAAWKRGWKWWTPRLAWGLALGLVVVLVVSNAIDPAAQGPAGYGTGNEPVAEVLAVEDILEGGAAPDYPGFASFAAATSWLGGDEWEPYRMHATMALPLLALLALPLMLYGERRGIGRLGTAVLLAIGVATPPIMVALAIAQTSMLFAAIFATAGTVALLLGRRDRGWYAIAALQLGALLAVGGPGALLAPALVTAAWLALRRGRGEHMPASEKPAPMRHAVMGGVAAGMVAVVVAAPGLVAASGLPWRAMTSGIGDSLRMWPFTWLDEARDVAVPHGLPDMAFWGVGIALLCLVVVYAVQHSDRRELAIVVGVAATAPAALAIYGANPTTSQQLLEAAIVLMSPLLAGVVVRALGIARARAAERAPSRLPGAVPGLLVAAIAVISLATAATSGGRIVQAPHAAELGGGGDDERLYVASADPWVGYLAGAGALTDGSGRDLDQLPMRGEDSLLYGNWSGVVRTADPFASDPPGRFVPSADPEGSLAVDMFQLAEDIDAEPAEDALAETGATAETGRPTQGDDAQDRGGAAEASADDARTVEDLSDVLANTEPGRFAGEAIKGPARFHLPAEPPGGDGPGGLLLPSEKLRPAPADHPVRQIPCPDAPLVDAGGDRRQNGTQPPAREEAAVPVPPAEVDATDAAELCVEVTVPDDESRLLHLRIQSVGMILEPDDDGNIAQQGFTLEDGMFVAAGAGGEVNFLSPDLFGLFRIYVEGGPGARLRHVDALLRSEATFAPGGYGDWATYTGVVELDGDITLRSLGEGARVGRIVAVPNEIPAQLDAVVEVRNGSVWSYPSGLAGAQVSAAVVGVGVDGTDRSVATIRLRTSAGVGLASEPLTLMLDWIEGHAGTLRRGGSSS